MVASATPRMGPYIYIYIYISLSLSIPPKTEMNPKQHETRHGTWILFLQKLGGAHTHTFDFSNCPHGYTGLNPSHPLGYNHVHEVE